MFTNRINTSTDGYHIVGQIMNIDQICGIPGEMMDNILMETAHTLRQSSIKEELTVRVI